MPCYHPIELQSADKAHLVVSCGQCIGCRLERSRQWAVRCVHEASLHPENCFITLTYNEEHLDQAHSLVYRDFQLFMKKLRRRFAPTKIRFYMCGEYGEKNGRPHFHACLFNFDFPDKNKFKQTKAGPIYTAPDLDQVTTRGPPLWPHGFASVGAVTFESAAYVARYIMKKMTGDGEDQDYRIYDPATGEIHARKKEFNKMSLKPGIGATWFYQYWDEVKLGRVIMNGVESNAPRYYCRMLKKMDMDQDLVDARFSAGLERRKDQTPQRLQVRETVAKAKVNQLKRSL